MTPITASEKSFIQKLLVTVGVVCLTLLLLSLVYLTFDIILLIVAAVLVAIFLRGLADLLTRYVEISEGWAVLVVSLVVVGILAGAVALLAPSVAEQVAHLRGELPRSAQRASDYIARFSWGRAIIDNLPSTETIRENLSAATLLSRVGGIFSSTIGAVGNFLVMILLSIYLASEPKFYVHGLTKLFPVDRRTRVLEVLAGIGDTLRWWLIGKAGSMIFIGILTWIGLSIIGVPLALTLGLIAGLLSFIPNFGPIISALPAILLAFVDSPIKAAYVLALFVGVQLLESNIITPLIERETVELPPGLTIVFQLALGVLIGGLGLVLATPILAAVMVVVQMVYVQDILGDRDVDVVEKVGEAKIEHEAVELDEPDEHYD